jgi:hypothetical protein
MESNPLLPFRQSARVVVANTHKALLVPAFYGAVTCLTYPSEEPLARQGYFHAQYRQEHPTSPDRPYLILDTETMGLPKRPGHFVGVVLSAEATRLLRLQGRSHHEQRDTTSSVRQ